MADEVTNISNIRQLILFLKYCDYNKEKVETGFIDCSRNADAIVSFITDQLQELKIEILHLKAFVSDEPSFIVDQKKWCRNQINNKLCLENV